MTGASGGSPPETNGCDCRRPDAAKGQAAGSPPHCSGYPGAERLGLLGSGRSGERGFRPQLQVCPHNNSGAGPPVWSEADAGLGPVAVFSEPR
jgi:hypothetical protein